MTSQEILSKARSEAYALGAFNAGNLEIAQAVAAAAQAQRSPVIIETSAGEAAHFGMENFLAVIENLRQKTNLPFLTNFDHGPGLEECQKAIKAGYNLVHFDGSKLPYEENVKVTKVLVKEAHSRGVLIEAEIDRILGESAYHHQAAESDQASANYTEPEKAAEFVQRTGCDLLAIFIGNLHGTYREPPKLDLERMKLISQEMSRQSGGGFCLFTLHGGSGLLAEDIRAAVKLGVVKVNVNTELRLAYRETLMNVLRGSEELAVYKIMPPVMAAVQKVVEEKIQLFGSSQKALLNV